MTCTKEDEFCTWLPVLIFNAPPRGTNARRRFYDGLRRNAVKMRGIWVFVGDPLDPIPCEERDGCWISHATMYADRRVVARELRREYEERLRKAEELEKRGDRRSLHRAECLRREARNIARFLQVRGLWEW